MERVWLSTVVRLTWADKRFPTPILANETRTYRREIGAICEGIVATHVSVLGSIELLREVENRLERI